MAESLHDWGLVNLDLGKVLQAESLMQHALAIREKALGREHLDTARSIACLQTIYSTQGRISECEQLGLEALAIHLKLLGQEHPDTASSFNSLASTKSDLGDLSEAEQLARQALAIREKRHSGKNILIPLEVLTN